MPVPAGQWISQTSYDAVAKISSYRRSSGHVPVANSHGTATAASPSAIACTNGSSPSQTDG